MRFGHTDGFLVASLITGPRHLLLQLKLAKESQAAVSCESLPPRGNCRHRELCSELIVEAVSNGVAEASMRSGSALYPIHIRYVGNDTGPEAAYGALAAALVQEVASGRLELP